MRSSALPRASPSTSAAAVASRPSPSWRPVISDISALCTAASDGGRPAPPSGRMAVLSLDLGMLAGTGTGAELGPVLDQLQLAFQLLEGGHVLIPLDHGRAEPEAAHRLGVQLPHLAAHVAVVGVDQQ